MWDDTPEKKLADLQRAWFIEQCVCRYLESLQFVAIHRGKSSGMEQHGPQFYCPSEICSRPLPLLDIEVFWPYLGKRLVPHGLPPRFFADVKEKNGCSFFKQKNRWQSGIDRWFRDSYCIAERLTFTPVQIFHFIGETPSEVMDKRGVPNEYRPAPTGLYVHSVLQPIADSHTTDYEDMVYWAVESDMKKIADLSTILKQGEM